MDFKVKGHSNYNLKLHENVVTKSASTGDIRLVKSALKQKEFKSNYFKSPNVIEINNDSFLMEYIQGESFSQFFTFIFHLHCYIIFYSICSIIWYTSMVSIQFIN